MANEQRSEGQRPWSAIVLAFGLSVTIFSVIIGSIIGRVIDNGCIGDCLTRQDVSMQANMALAAWSVLFVSAVSGIGSLYLIYRTLKAALRSAEAAEETVRETRRIGEAQSRAYLTAIDVYFEEDPHDWSNINFAWTIFNAGQSPARTVEVTMEFAAYAEIENRWELCDREERRRTLADIPSGVGKPDDDWVYLNASDEQKEAWRLGAARLEVTGTIDYIDIFGREQTDDFYFRRTYEMGDDWTDRTEMPRRSEPPEV